MGENVACPPQRLIDVQTQSLQYEAFEAQIPHADILLEIPKENNLAEVVSEVFRALATSSETCQQPECEPVAATWVTNKRQTEGSSSSSKTSSGHVDLFSSAEQGPVILYVPGGQFWRRGRSRLWIANELSSQAGARCLTLDYRLSPQNPFPLALTDCLAAYLSLLYPPSGSLHESVLPQEVFLAGDSAGGNLVISLLQFILAFNRIKGSQALPLIWDGQERPLPIPTAVSVLSPYVDLTRCFDSEEKNLKYDIIPARGAPFTDFARCQVWPAVPSRHHVYADDASLLHPLVSPVTAMNWNNAPPVWFCVGEECLADQGMFVAQQMASAHVPVNLEQYSTMPHNFPMLIKNESSTQAVSNWSTFIRSVIERAQAETKFTRWTGRKLITMSSKFEGLVPVSAQELPVMMRNQIASWGQLP